MKRYYNTTTREWYYEGRPLTRKTDNGVFSGIPTTYQLKAWGFEESKAPETTPIDPTEQRKSEILSELQSMDYLTSKFIDGEDMSEYGDWQERRKALREEYRELEKKI